MHILYHDLSGSGGGSGISLRALTDSLEKGLFQCSVLLGDDQGEEEWSAYPVSRIIGVKGYPNYDFAPNPLTLRGLYSLCTWIISDLRFTRSCLKFLRDLQPDLIHLNSGGCTAMARAARKARIPVVWHIRELPRTNLLTRMFYQPFLRRHATKIICISQAVARRLPDQAPPPVVLLNPVANIKTPSVGSSHHLREQQREKWEITTQDFVVLLMGSFTVAKGYVFLHEVAQQCSHPNVVFVIAGNTSSFKAGPVHTLIRRIYRFCNPFAWNPERIARIWQTSSVRRVLPGRVVAEEALSAADLVVCPNTVPEPFGRTVIEAYAAGKPVLTSDLPAFDETVRHGETGWRLPLSATVWAERIEELASRPEQILEMRAAISKACERYNPEPQARIVEKLYQEVLDSFKTATWPLQ